MKKNHTPTIKDVALEAGVAIGTVSKVINGLPVGDAYRLKVEAAIQKLGYQVNSYAQGLKARKTFTIALILPSTDNPFFADLIFYINKALMKRKYKMLLCCSEANQAIEQDYIQLALQNKVDGIIGLTYNPHLKVDSSIPFISIDRSMGPGIPCIASDNYAGGQMAAEKLASLGCRRLAFLRTGSALNNEPNKRKSGFENGCLLHGLSYDCKIIHDDDPLEDFLIFLKEHLHDGKLDYDGIFCATDYQALKVKRMLESLGLKIPDDVQLIGFDGSKTLDGSYYCSTIVQPTAELAELCVEMVLQEHSTITPPLICLPVTYAPGGTTREPYEGSIYE